MVNSGSITDKMESRVNEQQRTINNWNIRQTCLSNNEESAMHLVLAFEVTTTHITYIEPEILWNRLISFKIWMTSVGIIIHKFIFKWFVICNIRVNIDIYIFACGKSEWFHRLLFFFRKFWWLCFVNINSGHSARHLYIKYEIFFDY